MKYESNTFIFPGIDHGFIHHLIWKNPWVLWKFMRNYHFPIRSFKKTNPHQEENLILIIFLEASCIP